MTTRQISIETYAIVYGMEHQMVDLNTAVVDLTAVVVVIKDRLAGNTAVLQQALNDAAAARVALATVQAAETADQDQIAALLAAVADANTKAQDAADAIEANVAELGTIGQVTSPPDPTPDPVPVPDPVPAPEPDPVPAPEPPPAE